MEKVYMFCETNAYQDGVTQDQDAGGNAGAPPLPPEEPTHAPAEEEMIKLLSAPQETAEAKEPTEVPEESAATIEAAGMLI